MVTNFFSRSPPVLKLSSEGNAKRKRTEWSAEQKRLAVFVSEMPMFSVRKACVLFGIDRPQTIYLWKNDDYKGVNRYAVHPDTAFCQFADRPGADCVARTIMEIIEVVDRSTLSDEELRLLFESFARDVSGTDITPNDL